MKSQIPDEEVVKAYQQTGSVWRAAKSLGLCGQSVWERLRRLGHPLKYEAWTEDEDSELAKNLTAQCTIGEIASRLGRTYAGVASRISKRGLGSRYGNRRERKIPRGAGLDKARVARMYKELNASGISLRQYCRRDGMAIDLFVIALQKHNPEQWNDYSKRHGLEATVCHYCGAEYYPMSKKQKNCTRQCGSQELRDRQYFGGNRRATIGLAEGRCQLCKRVGVKGLSSHHVFGKSNDPDNACLIALCPGCHKLVGLLATRTFIDDADAWESLIALALMRRRADVVPGTATAVYTCVDIEFLREDADGEEHDVPRRAQLPLGMLEPRT